nr:vanadium-dependent haloperoxidase [uncultured Arsenicibacter sp.]
MYKYLPQLRLPASQRVGGVLLVLLTIAGCKQNHDTPDPVLPAGEAITGIPADVAAKWGDMTLRLARNTPGNTPTFASRSFGYMGLTMYETGVYGIPDHQSLAGQVAGISSLPQPESGKTYDWVLSINAGQAFMLSQLYENTADKNKQAIDSLSMAIKASRTTAADVADRSEKFGLAVAQAIYEFSKTDGGHQGYKDTFPLDYVLPTAPGNWIPPTDGQVAIRRALHPYWGNNRRFVAANGNLPVPKPETYTKDPASNYYKLYKAVYDKNISLTQEEKEIAAWWGDDPSQTFTPPGHSYNLATIAIRTKKATLAQAVETYARTGMAIADAFMNCWKCKYTYHNERPSTFVRANVNAAWTPFWPEPPFPAFPSGHSTQGAAAATVLTDLYGANVSFVDNSHVGRARDELRNVDYKARSFTSFWQTAEESAWSRFLGGIHTQQDNDTGLAEGKKIGENVNKLGWKK